MLLNEIDKQAQEERDMQTIGNGMEVDVEDGARNVEACGSREGFTVANGGRPNEAVTVTGGGESGDSGGMELEVVATGTVERICGGKKPRGRKWQR